MDATIIGGLVELAKMGLTIYFRAMEQATMTEEEKEKLFLEVEAEFMAKVDTPLPEVPK